MKKLALSLMICSIYIHSMEEIKKPVVYIGGYSVQGTKATQDDRYAHHALEIEGYGQLTCSGVFDGHGTNINERHAYDVSAMASERFFIKLNAYLQKNNQNEIEDALLCATASCEKKTWKQPLAFYFAEQRKQAWQDNAIAGTAGSTMTVSCFEHNAHTLHIAWLGDSRAVVGGNGTIIFATKDHKPTDEEEKKYIEQYGGFVGDDRVCKSLAVSRALGDIELKKCYGCGPINTTPEYKAITITENDEFYIEASDGFWDVVENEEVPVLVHDSLHLEKQEFEKKYPIRWPHYYCNLFMVGSASKRELLKDLGSDFPTIAHLIAARLAYIAVLNRGSSDDTAVVVKVFDWKNELHTMCNQNS